MGAAGGQDRAGLGTETVVALNHVSAALRGVAVVVLCCSYVLLLLPVPQRWTPMVLDAQLTIVIVMAVGIVVCALRGLVATIVTNHPGHLAPLSWDPLRQSPVGAVVAWLLASP